MAAMRFEPLQKDLGFEIAVTGALPWQMVPRGGARGVLLLDAPDYALRTTSLAGGGEPGGLTMYETTDSSSTRREIWLSGQKKGKYELQVLSKTGPAVVYSLAVDVLNERTIKVAYYFLPGVSKRFDAALLTKRINEIWFGPANVSVNSLGAWGNDNGESIDLTREIDIAQSASKLRDYGGHGAASWLVYFGWTIAGSEKGKATNGITRNDQTLIDLSRFGDGQAAKLGHTLAHELGHYISMGDPRHDAQKTDLMFDTAAHDGSNNRIRRPRALQVIRP